MANLISLRGERRMNMDSHMNMGFFFRMGVEQDILVQCSGTEYSIGFKGFFSSL